MQTHWENKIKTSGNMCLMRMKGCRENLHGNYVTCPGPSKSISLGQKEKQESTFQAKIMVQTKMQRG